VASIDDIIKKREAGEQFVISAPMLRLTPQEFHQMAELWFEDGGPGFNVVGMPFRVVVDGEFLISRVTAIRTTAL